MTLSTGRDPFDVDVFLALPLVAHAGGTDGMSLFGSCGRTACSGGSQGLARLPAVLAKDPSVTLVVDTCALDTLRVLQVTARGDAEIVPFDPARAKRKLTCYLGADERVWPSDFREFGAATRLVRLEPASLRARDFSKD